MKKKIFLLTVVVSICSFAINCSEASAYSKYELGQMCQTMGGTWSESSLKCTGGSVNSSDCSNYGGSYTNPTSNGHDYTPTCTWTSGSLDIANCIMAGSGTETQAICAGKISRAAKGTVATNCKKGGNKTDCENALTNSVYFGCNSIGSSQCDTVRPSYKSGVANILVTKNHDPCGNIPDTSAEKACKKVDGNWEWYYTSKPSDTPSNPGSSDDDDDDSSTTGGDGSIADVKEGQCTSILPGGWCDGKDGIGSIINMIVSILTGAVVVAGTVGIIICGFLWMTARDNEAQVAMAKKRMLDIVIGIVAWVLLALIANLFIPKTSSDIESDMGYNGNSSKDIKA